MTSVVRKLNQKAKGKKMNNIICKTCGNSIQIINGCALCWKCGYMFLRDGE